VHHIRERIAVDGEPVGSKQLAALIRTHKPHIAAAEEELGRPPSHFEVLTALSFAQFAASKVDVMVVETGLGGVRDATNIFPPESLACAVITTLDAVRSQLFSPSSSPSSRCPVVGRRDADVISVSTSMIAMRRCAAHAGAYGGPGRHHGVRGKSESRNHQVRTPPPHGWKRNRRAGSNPCGNERSLTHA